MMRKSSLIFIFAITALMFYTACGEDDDGGAGAPAAPGAPAAGSPECNNCPCKFYDVPMTSECWTRPFFRRADENVAGVRVIEGCALFEEADGSPTLETQVLIRQAHVGPPRFPSCSISTGDGEPNPGCEFTPSHHEFTPTILATNVPLSCRRCLEAYVDDLINMAMIIVQPTEDSFLCDPHAN